MIRYIAINESKQSNLEKMRITCKCIITIFFLIRSTIALLVFDVKLLPHQLQLSRSI